MESTSAVEQEDHAYAEPVRMAVAGYGNMGREHADAARHLDTVDIVAVLDRSEENLKTARADLGEDTGLYTDIDELLQYEDVDMLQDSTPPAAREAIVGPALEAGIDVFAEKPTGPDKETAKRLADTADMYDRTLRVVHQKRFDEGTQHMAHLAQQLLYGRDADETGIDADAYVQDRIDQYLADTDVDALLGEPIDGYLRLEQPGFYDHADPSVRASLVNDTGTHTLDALAFITDADPAWVAPETAARTDGIGVEYEFTVGMEHDTGTFPVKAEMYGRPQEPGEISADYAPDEIIEEIALRGEDGRISYRSEIVGDGGRARYKSTVVLEPDAGERREIVFSTPVDRLREQELAAFVDAYRGQETPLATGDTEAGVVAVAEYADNADEYREQDRVYLGGGPVSDRSGAAADD